jgi:hypothetical protein
MASSKWFYSANGQQHGPVSAAQLKLLADDGQLRPDDLVRQEGSEQWVAASRLKGLFTPTSPPVPPVSQPPIVDPLAQIQINVGNAVKGIGSAVKNVADSEQVKAAGVKIKNAAGQAAEGVGNFIRSDAVQSQVTAAKGSWAKLTTQNKLLAAGIGSLGLLMMSCCICGVLGNLAGLDGPKSNRSFSPNSDDRNTHSSTDVLPEETFGSSEKPIEAVTLLAEFENAASAKRKYGGKTVEVQGFVSEIREGVAYHFRSGRMFYVSIGGEDGPNGYVSWINCYFTNQEDIPDSVRKGFNVAIRGEVVHGEETMIEMRKCKVLRVRGQRIID